jgi:hypothetical protein
MMSPAFEQASGCEEMTSKRLLQRQVSLLRYLTSGDAIFGDRGPLDPDLHGVDGTLLRMEARFSHEKRMEKIAAVFPRTFELLGSEREALIREFVDACPPADIARLANARQFHDFLSARWPRQPPRPAYLPDVAACELACAQARAGCEDGATPANDVRRTGIRRRPGVVLLRCAFDIRPIFEAGAGDPVERDTPLAIVPAPDRDQPGIFELPPAVFDLLAALEGRVDAADLREVPETDALIADLARAGLMEVRG